MKVRKEQIKRGAASKGWLVR